MLRVTFFKQAVKLYLKLSYKVRDGASSPFYLKKLKIPVERTITFGFSRKYPNLKFETGVLKKMFFIKSNNMLH